MMIVRNSIMPLLGLDSGYTVKYSPLPKGTPSCEGIYLTVFLLSRPYTDTGGVFIELPIG